MRVITGLLVLGAGFWFGNAVAKEAAKQLKEVNNEEAMYNFDTYKRMNYGNFFGDEKGEAS